MSRVDRAESAFASEGARRRTLAAIVVAFTVGSALALGPQVATATDVPVASVAPASFDFGASIVGVPTASTTVTLSNAGPGVLTLRDQAITVASANPSDFQIVSGGTCAPGTTLNAGESCTTAVRFKPTAVGARSGLLRYYVNTPTGYVDATLGGVALDECAEGCF